MVQKEKKYITWEGLNQHAKNVGKKIKECDTGVIGGYNGSFPLTAATKGNIYLLPATKKYYVCIKNYNGSQLTAPNANFEELSVYTNRSKLDNLFEIKEQIGTQKIIQLSNLKMIFGVSENNNNEKIKIFFKEQFNIIFNVLITAYGNDPTTVRISHGSISKTSFEVVWQQFSGNDPITWVAFGI